MSELTIKSNHHNYPLLSGYELTKTERAELDYVAPVDDDDAWLDHVDRFFRYKGQIYDTQEFVRIVKRAQATGFAHGVEDGSPLLNWDGIRTDSYFSGVVVKYCADDGYVRVGLALS